MQVGFGAGLDLLQAWLEALFFEVHLAVKPVACIWQSLAASRVARLRGECTYARNVGPSRRRCWEHQVERIAACQRCARGRR